MATTATPYGLRPVQLLGGRVYAGSTRLMSIASGYNTSIFYGDVVKLVSSGTIQKDTSTNAMTPVGIFLGCQYTDSSLGYLKQQQYYPASTTASDIYAFVCDDPDAVFQAQANGTLAQTNIGNNIAVVQTAGTTAAGDSKIALDYASAATTTTLPLRIIDFVNGPFSAPGDAYTDVLVTWNFGIHQYRTNSGV